MSAESRVCPHYDNHTAAVLVRCDDVRGGLIRRVRTTSTFAFYERWPRIAITAGINPPGWTKGMWRRLADDLRLRHAMTATIIEP